jgi:hypothetical protein
MPRIAGDAGHLDCRIWHAGLRGGMRVSLLAPLRLVRVGIAVGVLALVATAIPPTAGASTAGATNAGATAGPPAPRQPALTGSTIARAVAGARVLWPSAAEASHELRVKGNITIIGNQSCGGSMTLDLSSAVEGGQPLTLGTTWPATTSTSNCQMFDDSCPTFAGSCDGGGYWLIGADGGMFAFGDARFHGSLPGKGIRVDDIAGMVAAPSGAGYLLVGADGGVFAFGATRFFGSLPGKGVRVADIRALLPAPAGTGYVLVGSDGGVFNSGHGAPFEGSLPGKQISVSDVVGIALTPDARGYWMAAANGTVYSFGDAGRLAIPAGVTSNLPLAAIAGV